MEDTNHQQLRHHISQFPYFQYSQKTTFSKVLTSDATEDWKFKIIKMSHTFTIIFVN